MNRIKKLSHLLLLAGFLLSCHQGYIALWADGSAEPLRVYPYKITTLPPADQQALRGGIRAENEQELARLLEDYLS